MRKTAVFTVAPLVALALVGALMAPGRGLAAEGRAAPQSGHAYSECVDGYWQVVSYSLASDGVTLVRTVVDKTDQKCTQPKPGEKRRRSRPDSLKTDDIGDPPAGECLTADDIKYAERLSGLYEIRRQQLLGLMVQLKAAYQSLAEAEKDVSSHPAEAQEALVKAKADIEGLQVEIATVNAAIRYISELLLEAQKPPCDGVKEHPPEPPTDWPGELPPAIELPDRPIGACYANADNDYEQKLKALLKQEIEERDALYNEIRPWLLREDQLMAAYNQKQGELSAQPPPLEPERKRLERESQEDLKEVGVMRASTQETLLRMQAIDAAIVEINQRLSLPPKPPCDYSYRAPSKPQDGLASETQPARMPSPFEAGVLAEINRARTDPAQYGLKSVGLPASLVEDARAFLRVSPALAALQLDDRLSAAAARQLADQGPRGQNSHIGSDGSTPMARIQAAGVWSSITAEEIAVGEARPDGVVAVLIIDPPGPQHQHRADLFHPMLKSVGVACGANARFGTMCVIDMASAPVAR